MGERLRTLSLKISYRDSTGKDPGGGEKDPVPAAKRALYAAILSGVTALIVTGTMYFVRVDEIKTPEVVPTPVPTSVVVL